MMSSRSCQTWPSPIGPHVPGSASLRWFQRNSDRMLVSSPTLDWHREAHLAGPSCPCRCPDVFNSFRSARGTCFRPAPINCPLMRCCHIVSKEVVRSGPKRRKTSNSRLVCSDQRMSIRSTVVLVGCVACTRSFGSKGPFPFELTIFIGRHQLVDELSTHRVSAHPSIYPSCCDTCLERRELGGHEEEFTSTIPWPFCIDVMTPRCALAHVPISTCALCVSSSRRTTEPEIMFCLLSVTNHT